MWQIGLQEKPNADDNFPSVKIPRVGRRALLFGWSSRPLSLAHARQAFPLYLPLLPRGTPADFDQLNFIRCSNR